MKKGFWITAGLSGLVALFAFFLFVTWRPILISQDTEKGNNATVKNDQKTAGKEEVKPLESGMTINNFIQEAEIPKEPGFKPFFSALGGSAPGGEDELEKISETFLERFSALVNLPTSAPESASDFFSSQSTSTKKEQSVASAPEATSTEIILLLTDDEFHFLYPDAFIASLMEAQNLFIKEYDPNYESLSKIETDSHVRFIEEKLVAALFSANMITNEQAERFITTIRFTLPQLQITELKNRKSSILNQSFMSPILPPSFPRPSLKGLFLAELVERIYSAFIPEAQAYVCGYCIYLPECFQVGVPNPVGFNVLKTFCYCSGCYHGQGCLDFCESMSAIWDPMTGICGCG